MRPVSRYFGQWLAILAMLLQVSLWLQPVVSADHHGSGLCMVVIQALHSDAANQPDHPHLAHHHPASGTQHDQHGATCNYCLSHAQLTPLDDAGLKPVLIRIQVRLVAYLHSHRHVYFQLLSLFLLPQGRAPPVEMMFWCFDRLLCSKCLNFSIEISAMFLSSYDARECIGFFTSFDNPSNARQHDEV